MKEERYLEAMNVLGHELRRPLTVIRGAATLLLEALEDMEPAGRNEMLELIDRNVEDMGEMIEDLVAAVHLQVGDLRLDSGSQKVAELLEWGRERCRRLDPQRPVAVAQPDPGLEVEVDQGYARRALGALLANAFVHTPEGSPVELGVRADTGLVRFEVLDRGPGVAPESMERAFQPFTKLSGGTSGLGLGLFVARGLARAMGGDAGLEPRPGGGSVAWLTLKRSVRI